MIKKNDNRVIFFLILGVAIFLRYFHLNKGYHSDEGALIELATHKSQELLSAIKGYHAAYGPLGVFLFHLWLKISHEEIWARSYFVLFGIALLILIYRMGRYYLHVQFGLILLFLAAISPFLIWSSQYVRNYIEGTFWIILTTFFLLKILKEGFVKKHVIGYIISGTLALYSSYLSIGIICAHTIFFIIIKIKDLKNLCRFILSQGIIVFLFLPCFFLISHQTKVSPAINGIWHERSLKLWEFHIGYYVRTASALIGIDPGFLEDITFSKTSFLGLIFLVLLASFLGVIFFAALVRGFQWARKMEEKEKLWMLFFPLLTLFSTGIYHYIIVFLDYPFLPKYFISQHVLFLFVLAVVIYSWLEKSKSNKKYLAGVVIFPLIFLIRYPYAVEPTFGTKDTYVYLREKIRPIDCLVITRPTNRYLVKSEFHIIELYSYLKRDSFNHDYIEINIEGVRNRLQQEKCEHLWYYRLYGNDEILGANRLVFDALQKSDFKIIELHSFKKIDLIYWVNNK